jgi:hypothetical protein
MRRGLLPPADPVESIAERKLRRRQLTEDGNAEISERDFHKGGLPRSIRSSAQRAARPNGK